MIPNYILNYIEKKVFPDKYERVNKSERKISMKHLVQNINENGDIYIDIFSCIGKHTKDICTYKINKKLQLEDINLQNHILKEFFSISIYTEKMEENVIIDNEYINILYEAAYEKAICNYFVANDECSDKIWSLIKKLKSWSQKTYEGNKMPFGILFDMDDDCIDTDIEYANFLDSKFSANLSDGINSAILLNKYGKFITYLPNDIQFDFGVNHQDGKHIFTPQKYEKFSSRCCKNMLGLILTETGQILLIKERRIFFVYKNNNWIYYSYNLFSNSIFEHLGYDKCQDLSLKKDFTKFVSSIYSSILDMIFAGEGCCISIVKEKYLNDCRNNFYESLNTVNSNVLIKEKKSIITKCIDNRKFVSLSRKLRQDLLSYDGALILREDGSFEAVGEIVKLDSKSSEGGGRTKAAKLLATVGIGIKVSEDGSIDCYGTKDVEQKDENTTVDDMIIKLFEIN